MKTAAMPLPTRSLSALDMAFFVLESKDRMSNIGPLAILQPPARTRNASAWADRLLARMKQQTVGAPFNLRYRPPGLKGLPRLETVAEIDLDRHCHRHTLAAPGTDADLFDFVCRLHEKRIDRARPPWEFHVIDGLQGGRVALYAKVHHGLIDGRGFVEVCTRWFATEPADRQPRAIWQGVPARPQRSVPARAAVDVAALAGAARKAARATLSLYAALARQAMASTGLVAGMPLPFIGTPAALRSRVSVRRSFAYCVLPLAAMKAFGKAHEASINDVLLTVLDMALHRYLEGRKRSHPDQPLVADMPVALGDGNGIAILQFPLGAPAASPGERLAQIRQRTAEVKEHVRRTDPVALVTYTAAVHGVPALLEALGVERAPMLANMVISNPFGLPEKRYLMGASVEMALPVSILAPGQSLNITAATYDQGLQIAFLGIAAEMPDIQRLADLTVEAFDLLTQSSAKRPVRQSRSARAKPLAP